MNWFFEQLEKETEPMYDAGIVDENGVRYWYKNNCNYANNSRSVTKLFVSCAVGTLVTDGRLSLESSVTSFFTKDELPSSFDEKWNNVTVKDTLRHKTGITQKPYGIDVDDDYEKIGNDFLKYVFSLKIDGITGETYKYTDEAYYLLGRIIEKASGERTLDYFRNHIMNPLGFKQWAMSQCPMGFPICGDNFFARSDDIAKLGFALSCDGVYNGKRIVSKEYIDEAIKNDYALTEFRNSGVFVKTGACGQMVAFSKKHKTGVAWHGYSNHGNERNDRLLEYFCEYLSK